MGKVTVFAIDGCPFCVRAKNQLKDRNIPYTEINLTSHPDKRSDMLSLSDSLTVPQIFFNEAHIGGATELIQLLEQWDLDDTRTALQRFEEEIKTQPDPTDPRLQPSTLPAYKEPPPPPRNEDDMIQIPIPDSDSNNSKGVPVLEIMERLLKTLPSSDLSHNTTTYKNVFRPKELLHTIMNEFSIQSKEQAIEFGQYLQTRHIFDHVTGDHIYGQNNNLEKKLFFRLQPYQTPHVLNSYRVWEDNVRIHNEDTTNDPLAIVSRLSKLMQSIQKRATNNDGNVDLASAALDVEYATFQEGVCELQSIDMSKMNDDVHLKSAFVINVYNLMIKYAQIKHGVPSNNLQRVPFFTKIYTNIGGIFFSFNELENGILRANSPPPYGLKNTFSSTSKRLKFSLKKTDVNNRIHFALNCGAKSCPPVKKFTSTDLEEELRIVALAFCEQDDNVKLNPKDNEVHLNTIFNWYRSDFAKSNSDLPKALLRFMRDGERKDTLQTMIDSKKSIKVKFNVYDWSSSVANSKVFDASALKAVSFLLF